MKYIYFGVEICGDSSMGYISSGAQTFAVQTHVVQIYGVLLHVVQLCRI